MTGIQHTETFMDARRRDRTRTASADAREMRSRAAGFVVMILILALVAAAAFVAFVAMGDSQKGAEINGPAPAEAPANP